MVADRTVHLHQTLIDAYRLHPIQTAAQFTDQPIDLFVFLSARIRLMASRQQCLQRENSKRYRNIYILTDRTYR